jgi:hypothetical protein
MNKINGKELEPYILNYGQRKELRRKLAEAAGRANGLFEAAEKNGDATVAGKATAAGAMLSSDWQETLLLHVYAGKITQADINESFGSEVPDAAIAFLEANEDPTEAEASKKASSLLQKLAR